MLKLIAPKRLYLERAERTAEELASLFGYDLADQPLIACRQLQAVKRFSPAEELRRVGVIPTLVVSGVEDRITPPKCGKKLSNLIPGARFEEISAAAHTSPYIKHRNVISCSMNI